MVDSPRIAVRPTPGELQVYKGVTWSQPSTDLVEATVLRALEDSGQDSRRRARRAAASVPTTSWSWTCAVSNPTTPAPRFPRATIELTAKLLHASDQRIVASRTFLQVEPAGGTEVAQVAAPSTRRWGNWAAEVAGWVLVTGEADASAIVDTP